jgi:hypothetical protein
MSYQVSGISSIENYAGALDRWTNTKHIRGRAEDQRPLGKRSKIDSFRIFKQENGNIQCFLYNTPVVTFTPEDNIVISLNQWISSSTCKFISELVWRLGIQTRVFDGSICVKFSDGGEYRLHSKAPTTLTRAKHPEGGMDTFTLSDWDKRIVHMVDRKGKREALAPYRPFEAWLRAFIKLRADEEIKQTEVAEALTQGHYLSTPIDNVGYTHAFNRRVKYLNKWASSTMENKHEDFYRAAMLMCMGNFIHERRAYMDMEFYESMLLGVNRDKVFKEVQVPDGEVKKDAYKGFYGSNWDSFHAHDDSQNT